MLKGFFGLMWDWSFWGNFVKKFDFIVEIKFVNFGLWILVLILFDESNGVFIELILIFGNY